MTIGWTLLIAAAAAAVAADPPTGIAPRPSLDSLAWLEGRWRTEAEWLASGPRWTEEIWTDAATGTILGLSRTSRGFGRGEFEFLRIERDGEGAVILHASPSGAPAVPFRLAHSSRNEAVFENPAHDYPQRIHYRRDGEALEATISLIDGSRARSWRFLPYRGGGD